MITKGTTQINKIALGSNEIGRIYLGNDVVYGEEESTSASSQQSQTNNS